MTFPELKYTAFLWVLVGLTCVTHSLQAQDTTEVVELEYFFDADPGYGNATSILVTADSTVSISQVLLSNSLPVGFHTLYMRARNVQQYMNFNTTDTGSAIISVDSVINPALRSAGQWGMAESRPVYVDPTNAAEIQIVDAIEYFFDADPGYGNGVATSAFTPSSIISQNETLLANSLSVGFHTLYIRAHAQGGSWGMAESRPVYVDPSNAAEVQIIDAIEYFFDVDPGYGSGTSTTSFSPDSVIFQNEVLISNSLGLGFHTLFVRARAQGGKWGMTESRPFYVDPSDASVVQIVNGIEYFFNEDPGFGSATALTVTPGTLVNYNDLIISNSLSPGFHTLFIRAQTDAGVWGITESRPVYIDNAGSVNPVTNVEYFFDTDPGYGAGNIVSLDNPSDSLVQQILVNSVSLPAGPHTLFMRVQDQSGNWSMLDSATFTAFNPGRELDSAALVLLYDTLAGSSWNTATNWLSTGIESWFGVTVSNNRVSSLDLTSNGVSGILPNEIRYLDAIQTLDLRANSLSDSIPSGILDMTSLVTLDLRNNQLTSLPNLTVMPNIANLRLDANRFDFTDLEPQVGIVNFTYANQQPIPVSDTTIVSKLGDNISFSFSVPGSQLLYQWFLNGDTLVSETTQNIAIADFSTAQSGTYSLLIGSQLLPDLTFSSGNYFVLLPSFELDSASLVELYNSMGGSNWTQNSGWLTDSLINWSGVRVVNGRVTEIILPSNNLTGSIPSSISTIDSLIRIDLSSNALEDTLPSSLGLISTLSYLNLADNNLNILPEVANVDSLLVSRNSLEFEAIESNIGVSYFEYADQDSIGQELDTLLDRLSSFQLSYDVTGANNNYQWYKSGNPISGQITDSLLIDLIQYEDSGSYYLEISNSQATQLTLYSQPVNINTSSLKADSAALIMFYNNSGGENWNTTLNWEVAPISQWDSITIIDNHVSELTLQDIGINDSISDDLLAAQGLTSVDLSDNQIEKIPDFTTLPYLNSLDISNNSLEFGPLEANASITGIDYSNQAPLGQTIDTLIDRGETIGFSLQASGSANQYTWLKSDSIEVSLDTSFSISNAQFENAGRYNLRVTNSLVPGLTLESNPIKIIVSSLKQDSVSLLVLYDSAGGEFWQPAVNWTSEPVTSWERISIGNERVTQINLSSLNLSGSIPQEFTLVNSLVSADFSQNSITAVADISEMSNLQVFDVTDNNLHYDILEKLAGNSAVVYNPQKRLLPDSTFLKIPQGSAVNFSFNVRGENNFYQWKKNNTNIDGEMQSGFTNDSVGRSDIGFYHLEVISPIIQLDDPSFILSSDSIEMQVTANITGRIVDINDDPLETGQLAVLEIRSGRAAYDTLDQLYEVINGSFSIENILLRDYILLVDTDDDTYIPTYYRATEDWVRASPIPLIKDTLLSGFVIQGTPEAGVDGDGKLDMLVESDFLEENSGKIDARRRVRKAGCSLRRRSRGGRTDQDTDEEGYVLIAYKETDEEGNVSFGNLPEGEYKINIQYPGIPMDESSEIVFEILEGEAGAAFNAVATITEDGISVELEKILGVLQKYFKDLSIYPNPANESFTLKYKSQLSENVSMRMVNLSGSMMKEMAVEKGYDQEIKVNTTELKEGIYILYFYDRNNPSDEILTFKVVVEH